MLTNGKVAENWTPGSPFFYLVAADYKYIPELTALLNSLDYVGNEQDVHIIGVNLTEEFKSQLSLLKYKVVLHEIGQKTIEESRGISEVVCRKRYWYAAEIGSAYLAGNVLDADLVFCRDPIQFFEIADKTGLILGVTKEQNKVYDDPHHEIDGGWNWKNVPRGFWNDKDLCNCPFFFNTKRWAEALKWSWEIFLSHGFKAPDMDALCLALLEFNGYDRIVKLPGLQWLGTNEQHLKPYTRVTKQRDGNLWTENGLEIFSFHGQYYKQKWRDCQLSNRHGCAAGYLGTTEKPDNMAQGAMSLLYERFLKMLDYKIQIEKKEYVYP